MGWPNSGLRSDGCAPWAKVASMVELMAGLGGWASGMVERMPEELGDDIQLCHARDDLAHNDLAVEWVVA